MMAVPIREGTLGMLSPEHLKLPPWNPEAVGVFQEHPQSQVSIPPSGAAFPHAEQQPQQICP